MITKGDDSVSSCCVTVPTPFLFHYRERCVSQSTSRATAGILHLAPRFNVKGRCQIFL